jgi:predicted nucleic acid-binding protein
VEMTRDDWQQAGDLSASLRRKGITIPLSDLVIGLLAVRAGVEILTTDPHFKKIPGLIIHPVTETN